MSATVIDVDELSARWNSLGSGLPERWILGGITFYGDMAKKPWSAFLVDAGSYDSGPEGFGATPFDAISDLERDLAKRAKKEVTDTDGVVG